MSSLLHPIAYYGYTMTTRAFPVVIALLFWGVLVLLELVWPRRRRGWTLDILTIVATIALGVAWQQTVFDTQKPKIVNETLATCPIVDSGTRAADLRKKIGAPDRIVPEEETRGPGATVWVYDKSRCTVHLLSDTVEYTE